MNCEEYENYDLGSLAESHSNHGPLNIENVDTSVLLTYLREMTKLRMVENIFALKKKEGLIKGPVHLAAGQEAIPVGISSHLKKGDMVFGTHRSHSHLLALGSDIGKLFSEILGKESGHSKGMGGSMHLIDKSSGFYGSVPIVGGTISLAVGAALSAKLNESSQISLAYFGDGATEEGVFHESMNLAKILNCPILFVCENNLFSSHLNINLRQPYNSIFRFAKANKIPSKIVDGNNVIEVEKSAKELIEISRNNGGPTFLEAITFRLYGHVDWRQDIDVGVNRSKKDLEGWRNKDPINRLISSMTENQIYEEEEYNKMCNELEIKLNNLWESASLDTYPSPESIEKYLYFSSSNKQK